MPTIELELLRLFPNGTRLRLRPDVAPWADIPLLPAEVFAAAAHLLEASGAYQYIVAPFSAVPPNDFSYSGPTFAPDQEDLDLWCRLGCEWRDNEIVGPVRVQSFWTQLWTERSQELVVNPGAGEFAPRWWSVAHALMVISDEASRDLGYAPHSATEADASAPLLWANKVAALLLDSKTELRIIPDLMGAGDDVRHLSRHVALDSLSPLVDRHVARVLPKGRTTEAGCVPRTFSHNLALLPPHGRANAYWHQAQTDDTIDTSLNLLLIPFPYSLPEHSFRGLDCREANSRTAAPIEPILAEQAQADKWLAKRRTIPSGETERILAEQFKRHPTGRQSRARPPDACTALPEANVGMGSSDGNMLIFSGMVQLRVEVPFDPPVIRPMARRRRMRCRRSSSWPREAPQPPSSRSWHRPFSPRRAF